MAGVTSRMASSVNLLRPEGNIHQHGGERSNFDGCVPAVHVAGRVSLSNANLLGIAYRAIKTVTVFHAGQDEIGGRVENGSEGFQLRPATRRERERKSARHPSQ